MANANEASLGDSSHRGSAILYGIVVLLWGSTFLWIRIAANGTSPFVIAGLRLTAGATVVWLIAIAFLGVGANTLRELRAWAAKGALLALLMACVPFVLLPLAERGVSSSTASALNATAPLFAVVILCATSLPHHAEQRAFRPSAAVGLAVGFAGVIVFVGGGPTGRVGSELLVLLSAATYSGAGVYAERVFAAAPAHTAPMLATGIGALLMLPLAVAGWMSHPPSAGAFWASCAAGALPNGIAYIAYFALVQRIGATRSLTVTYVMPGVAVLLGVAVLHETLAGREVAGLALVLLGVAAANGHAGALPTLGTRMRTANGHRGRSGSQAVGIVEAGQGDPRYNDGDPGWPSHAVVQASTAATDGSPADRRFQKSDDSQAPTGRGARE